MKSDSLLLLPRLPVLTAACLLLSACGTLGSLAGESFIFEGELPADFSLKAQAHYSVVNDCDGRSRVKTFETEYQSQPHQYRFKIPVHYRDGFCEMELGRVGLHTFGRYGEQDWQQTYDNGELRIVDELPESAPGFQADGSLTRQAECAWWFQISHARARKGQISKLLNCTGDGAYLAIGEVPDKTVRLNFRVNPEEKPAIDETWIEFSEGWKPCAEEDTSKGKWIWCRNPPQFRTFEMNGQECTVYPNCTE
ncbi:MAG TPA: hypothetical protein ENI17_15060 [Pseudomonas xinjiangensis]|uniref:Lipoprotein n=2 Tax=root TaxID=1 RepID=A0A7V1BTA3_9GAMM|nr:hypothetical protein [Halopseudomonas xinjiangensis]HEC48927.1 hypothetical protein [Halopseudomonas xinjiangensis]